jgi:hypothetical protein
VLPNQDSFGVYHGVQYSASDILNNSSQIISQQTSTENLQIVEQQSQDPGIVLNTDELQSCSILAKMNNDYNDQIHGDSFYRKKIYKMIFNMKSGIINLNIGGKKFSTTVSTLRKQEFNTFFDIINDPYKFIIDDSGSFFFDRSPKFFELILDHLRRFPEETDVSYLKEMQPLEIKAFLEDLEYYRLGNLESLVRSANANNQSCQDALSMKLVSDVSKFSIRENSGTNIVLIQERKEVNINNNNSALTIRDLKTKKKYYDIDDDYY